MLHSETADFGGEIELAGETAMAIENLSVFVGTSPALLVDDCLSSAQLGDNLWNGLGWRMQCEMRRGSSCLYVLQMNQIGKSRVQLGCVHVRDRG